MRKILLVLFAALAFAPYTPQNARADEADVFVVNMVSFYPEWHPVTRQVLRPWVKDVLHQTGGRLIIRVFDPNTICRDEELARNVRLGQVGMGYGFIGAEAGLFPLNMVGGLNLGLDNTMAGTAAFWRMHAELPEMAAEFSGIKLLALHATPPYQIHMLKDRVYGVSDLKDKRILVDNPYTSRTMALLGAVPVQSPQADYALRLEDRAADGALLTLNQAKFMQMGESWGQISLADIPSGACWIGMHQGLWDILPQDIRKVLAATSGQKLSRALGEVMYQTNRAAVDDLSRLAADVHYLSAEERGNIQKVVQTPLFELWQQNARKSGVATPRVLYEKIRKIASEASAANRI